VFRPEPTRRQRGTMLGSVVTETNVGGEERLRFNRSYSKASRWTAVTKESPTCLRSNRANNNPLHATGNENSPVFYPSSSHGPNKNVRNIKSMAIFGGSKQNNKEPHIEENFPLTTTHYMMDDEETHCERICSSDLR